MSFSQKLLGREVVNCWNRRHLEDHNFHRRIFSRSERETKIIPYDFFKNEFPRHSVFLISWESRACWNFNLTVIDAGIRKLINKHTERRWIERQNKKKNGEQERKSFISGHALFAIWRSTASITSVTSSSTFQKLIQRY